MTDDAVAPLRRNATGWTVAQWDLGLIGCSLGTVYCRKHANHPCRQGPRQTRPSDTKTEAIRRFAVPALVKVKLHNGEPSIENRAVCGPRGAICFSSVRIPECGSSSFWVSLSASW